MEAPAPRLTELAHGGGCGCKLSPGVLRELLAGQPAGAAFPQLLVGNESADDAAVWQISPDQAVIATTDFFMPMVDDPHDFGRIAAANAVSDIYAMGGTPILALAILGMPINKLDPATIRAILAGGAAVCAEAGIPVAGGHSIDAPEPIYGLAVIGLCHPDRVRRNTGARAGDAVILTKGLGIGIYSAAIKRGALPDGAYAEMVASATLLNRIGAELAADPAVHGITDVTGFGVLGHALEMARGSGVALDLRLDALPLLQHAAALAERGFVTGASERNWHSYGDGVRLPGNLPGWRRALLTDPQTSGGLLVSCAPEAADALADRIRAAGYPMARVIGAARAGEPLVGVA